MIAYDETKCEHNQLAARCSLCMAMKGKKLATPVALAPASITGGPPPDIENVHGENLRDRVDKPAPPDLIPEWEKPFDDVGAAAARVADGPAQPVTTDWAATGAHDAACNKVDVEYHVNSVPATLPAHSGQVLRVVPQSFDTLPTDDSHASKVVRAAAAFSKASTEWAVELASVESIKAGLLKAQAKLDKAAYEKTNTETILKNLVNEQERTNDE